MEMRVLQDKYFLPSPLLRLASHFTVLMEYLIIYCFSIDLYHPGQCPWEELILGMLRLLQERGQTTHGSCLIKKCKFVHRSYALNKCLKCPLNMVL